MRLLSSALALALAVGIGTLGCYTAWAQQQFAIVRIFHDKNPAAALLANVGIVNRFGWDSHIRQQLILTVGSVMRLPNANISPEAADRAFAIAMTAAPYVPSVRLARIEYLVASGRGSPEEMEEHIAMLSKTASLHPERWLAEAVWAVKINDYPRAEHAIEKGMTTPGLTRDTANGFYRVMREMELK